MHYFGLILLALLPFQMAIPLLGFELPLARVMSAILLVLWGVLFCIRASSITISRDIFLPLIGFLGWIGLSLLLQPDLPGDWLRKLVFLMGIYPLVIVWSTLIYQGHEYSLFKALVWGGVVSAFAALGLFSLQFWLGTNQMFELLTQQILPPFLGQTLAERVASFPSIFVAIGGETWLRATAFFPDPHVAAYFFGMVGFTACGLFLDTRKWYWLLAGLVLILTDLLTFSRGGYMGLLAGAVIFLGISLRRGNWDRKWIFLIGLVPVLTVILWPTIRRFISSFLLDDASSLDRFQLWQMALSNIIVSPWLGMGLGQYAEYIFPFQGAHFPYYAHNLYLDIAVEAGLVALFFFGWFLGAAFLGSLSRTLARGGGLSLGVTAGLAAYIVHSFFETPLFSTHVAIVLSLFIAFGATKTTKKSSFEIQ